VIFPTTVLVAVAGVVGEASIPGAVPSGDGQGLLGALCHLLVLSR